MNFFGHAAVASWRGGTPALALGAMLPDLAAIAGARELRVDSAEVERGVALHHATDAAFHGLPQFGALCVATTRRLRARGLERGPARAAAHVGVELVLDGYLLDDERAAALYLDALADRDALAAIHFDVGADRVASVIAKLAARGLPTGYREPAALSAAVTRALARRPRLALDERAAAKLAAEMPALIRAVGARAPALSRALFAAILR